MQLIPPGGFVIYDGDCGICTHSIRFLKILDRAKRLEFIANNTPKTYERFPDLSIERARQELLVKDPRTGWFGGFDAIEWIICRVPALWVFVPITLLPGINTLGHRVYKLVARNRHKISAALGLKACKIHQN